MKQSYAGSDSSDDECSDNDEDTNSDDGSVQATSNLLEETTDDE